MTNFVSQNFRGLLDIFRFEKFGYQFYFSLAYSNESPGGIAGFFNNVWSSAH